MSKKTLFLLIFLAFALRFALGAGAYFFLPGLNYGDSPAQKAGYLFYDAYRRDLQAAELAQSGQSLLRAFSGAYESDQYGGLLALSAAVYRLLRSHQPLAMIFLAALSGALGGWFTYAAAENLLGARAAAFAAGVFLFYPEAILLGAAQMREPFLMTLLAVFFAGLLKIMKSGRKKESDFFSLLSFFLALAGLLFFSPGIALLALLTAAGWWYAAHGWRGLSWRILLSAALIFLLGLAALSFSWNNLVHAQSGPLGIIGAWARETVKWNTHLLKQSSGIVQLLLESLPAGLALPFVTGYGLLQPVLPAALLEPAHPFWQTLGATRALGWYLLLPFVAYSFFSAWRLSDPPQRRQWLWLAALTWGWILIAALRGGGDQWDNPRYRVIPLIFLCLLAAQAWDAPKTRWFWRIVAVEMLIVLIFGHWYLYRYLGFGFNLGIRNTLALALGAAILGIAADWGWEQRRRFRV
ncbi:MAG: hypothetical protein Fur0035_18170 [Anaerolineales bacterium]